MNNNPKIISTWKHGFDANVKGLSLLEGGHSSIDAIESGAIVTEKDSNVRTVGYGGYTDNIGQVTL